MKRMILLGICLALLLGGCAQSGERSDEWTDDQGRMVYPGTQWNMTPEEVIEALELEEGAYEYEITQEYSEAAGEVGCAAVTVSETEVLGQHAAVVFIFLGYQDEFLGLAEVQCIFQDDADMDSLEKSLIELYGEPTEDDTLPEDYREDFLLWYSGVTVGDLIADAPNAPMIGEYLEEPACEVKLSRRFNWYAGVNLLAEPFDGPGNVLVLEAKVQLLDGNG